jgi:hypothetical protein
MPSPSLISGASDVLPYLGAGMTAGLGWFAAQFTGTARLQREVNAALHSLMDELQTQHAQDIARISELTSEIAQLRQVIGSLKAYMRRSGLVVPGEEIDAE